MKKLFAAGGLLVAGIFFTACDTTKRDQRHVEMAMQHYDRLILHLDADGISRLFMPGGNLGDIAIGRDSIKKFLSSFKNISVLSQESSTDSIHVNGYQAVQKGHYAQTDMVGKDTAHVHGSYTAIWQRVHKAWYMQKMSTKTE